jgi:hypothetical protein
MFASEVKFEVFLFIVITDFLSLREGDNILNFVILNTSIELCRIFCSEPNGVLLNYDQ